MIQSQCHSYDTQEKESLLLICPHSPLIRQLFFEILGSGQDPGQTEKTRHTPSLWHAHSPVREPKVSKSTEVWNGLWQSIKRVCPMPTTSPIVPWRGQDFRTSLIREKQALDSKWWRWRTLLSSVTVALLQWRKPVQVHRCHFLLRGGYWAPLASNASLLGKNNHSFHGKEISSDCPNPLLPPPPSPVSPPEMAPGALLPWSAGKSACNRG